MCRVSSDEQAKGYSLDIQHEQLTTYCNRNDINVLKHYREDHSAKDFNRPEFQNFLKYAKKNKDSIDLLLVTSWDRFSRNITDAFIILRELEALGIQVQAIEQPIDMSIPENKAMLALFLAIPEIDNDRRSIKIKGGMRAALKAGRWCRTAPFGYKNSRDEENKPIIIVNENAKYVKFLYEQFSRNVSLSELKCKVKEYGKEIAKNTIRNILLNPVYMGKIVVPELKDEPLRLVEGEHNGIISEKLFNKVQDIFASNKIKRHWPVYTPHKPEFPLRGVLYCSKCDAKMTASKSKGRSKYYGYYHCNECANERHKSEKVNSAIEDILKRFKLKKSATEIYKSAVKSLLKGEKKDLDKKKIKLEKSHSTIVSRIEKLQDIYIDGDIEKPQYKTTLERYKKEKSSITEQLETLKSENSNYHAWFKKGINFMFDFCTIYSKMEVSSKQRLLEVIFPEKMSYDGEKCRTGKLNEFLALILMTSKELQKGKVGQFFPKLALTHWVEPEGFEPSSKQGSSSAFYMFISLLIFDYKPEANTQFIA